MFLRLVSVIRSSIWFKGKTDQVIILNGNIQFDVMEYILHLLMILKPLILKALDKKIFQIVCI